jgi:hypothetical protein
MTLDIIRSFADVLTGAQAARTEEAIKRVLEGTSPLWSQFAGKTRRDPKPEPARRTAVVRCGDCRVSTMSDWPVGVFWVCDRCMEERRRPS